MKTELPASINQEAILSTSRNLQNTWDTLNQRSSGSKLLSIYRKFDLEANPVPEGIKRVAIDWYYQDNESRKAASGIIIFRKHLGHALEASQRYLRRFPDGNTDQEDLVQNIISRGWGQLNRQQVGVKTRDRNGKEPVLSLGAPLGGITDPRASQNPEQTVLDIEKQAYLERGRRRFYEHLKRLNLTSILEFVKTVSRDNLPYGIDTEQLDYLLETYRLPPFLKFFHKDDLRYLEPVKRRFAEFALAIQSAPIQDRQTLNLDAYGEIITSTGQEPTIAFQQLPGESFPAGTLLIACLASSDGEIQYPHLDAEGRITATTQLSATKAQRYFIERRAREVLAQNHTLRSLYPSRISGDASFSQDPNGELQYYYYNRRYYSGKYKNAVLDFPVGDGRTHINVALSENNYERAHYYHEIETIAITEDYLKSRLRDSDSLPESQQAIKNVALHEQNHMIFLHLTEDEQREIMDMFDSSDRNLIAFAESSYSSHIDIAVDYLKQAPFSETMTIHYNDSDIKVAKIAIIRELIAFATEEINTPRHLKSRLINKPRVIAGKCIRALPEENQQKLREYNLMMDANSAEFKEFFLAFEQALSILAPEYRPTTAKELQQNIATPTQVGSNRFRWNITRMAGIFIALAGLGLAVDSLIHDGIGFRLADGRGMNLTSYQPIELGRSILRFELQDSGPLDLNKPFQLDKTYPTYYPQLRKFYSVDIGPAGISYHEVTRQDWNQKP